VANGFSLDAFLRTFLKALPYLCSAIGNSNAWAAENSMNLNAAFNAFPTLLTLLYSAKHIKAKPVKESRVSNSSTLRTVFECVDNATMNYATNEKLINAYAMTRLPYLSLRKLVRVLSVLPS